MARLGGEYYNPSDGHPAHYGRTVFLARVADDEPQVLARLRDDVLASFRATWEESEPFVRMHFFPRGWSALARIPDEMRGPQLPAFATAVTTWAGKHHLTDDWLMDAALSTLRMWTEYPDTAGGRLHWSPVGPVFALARGEPPPLILRWQPETMLWGEFEREAKKELRRYRSTVEAWAQGRGLIRTPELRARARKPKDEHFEWLVLYQVRGWPYYKIAKERGVGEKRSYRTKQDKSKTYQPGRPAVMRAVTGLAKIIGLTLRNEQ